MAEFSSTTISHDLDRVAARLAATAVLDDEFCDRLTRSLTQLYALAEASFADDDLDCFDTILVRIAPVAAQDARLDLSDRISTTRRPPRRILLTLAHDEIEVARPVLENSPALTDEDLIDIARACGLAHMEAIAERTELSMKVTDILVLRGDDPVRRIVAGNGGAHLSDKSFARLSLQAKDDTIAEARLVGRRDLPDVVIRFLVDNGSPSARDILAARVAKASAKPLQASHHSIRATEDGWLEPYDFAAAADILQPLKNARHRLDGFVLRLAQTDRFAEIVHVLAEVSGLPLDTMKHVLVGLDTDAFVVVSRAIGLKPETVREILAIGPWLHRLDDRSREAAVQAFAALTGDQARTRLHQWTGARH